jgi:hypothetical protein
MMGTTVSAVTTDSPNHDDRENDLEQRVRKATLRGYRPNLSLYRRAVRVSACWLPLLRQLPPLQTWWLLVPQCRVSLTTCHCHPR